VFHTLNTPQRGAADSASYAKHASTPPRREVIRSPRGDGHESALRGAVAQALRGLLRGPAGGGRGARRLARQPERPALAAGSYGGVPGRQVSN